jgi:hypothetical protein
MDATTKRVDGASNLPATISFLSRQTGWHQPDAPRQNQYAQSTTPEAADGRPWRLRRRARQRPKWTQGQPRLPVLLREPMMRHRLQPLT